MNSFFSVTYFETESSIMLSINEVVFYSFVLIRFEITRRAIYDVVEVDFWFVILKSHEFSSPNYH